MYKNRRITAKQAMDIKTRYPNAILLDVRSEWEYNNGHIVGAVSLPDYYIEERAESVLGDCNTIVLVYCQVGSRSRGATSLLVGMGYKNAYDFGGIVDWPY